MKLVFLYGKPITGKTTLCNLISKQKPSEVVIINPTNELLKQHLHLFTKEEQTQIEQLHQKGKLKSELPKHIRCLFLFHLLQPFLFPSSHDSIHQQQQHSITTVIVYQGGICNIEEAEYLKQEYNIIPTLLMELICTNDTILMERVIHRRVDPITKETHDLLKVREETVKKRLIQRLSDSKEMIKARMKRYEKRIEPIICYYKIEQQVQYFAIDAMQPVEQVLHQFAQAITTR